MQNTAKNAVKTEENNISNPNKKLLKEGFHLQFSDATPFESRHISPTANEFDLMLKEVGVNNFEQLIAKTVPESIHIKNPLSIGPALSEAEALKALKKIANKNQVARSWIGVGYYDTHTPTVILRNILENPGWYTQYTPYQAEIAQGRLEALLNYQTLTIDLTGLPVANASLLDESTACAEAMAMAFSLKGSESKNIFYVSDSIHPHNRAVIETRAEPIGIKIQYFSGKDFKPNASVFGSIFQYPDTWGKIDSEIENKIKEIHQNDAIAVVCADPLSLMLLKSPGSLGADVAVGTFQRFGVPMGYGGPHAAYLACRDEYKRNMPGRIVGLSKDIRGNPAIRLALQTREQHIRREKATSNICTSQVLLAVMASMYAVYHGPKGLLQIASRIHGCAQIFANALNQAGLMVVSQEFFDTVAIDFSSNSDASGTERKKQILSELKKCTYNVREEKNKLSVSFDECTTEEELKQLIRCFTGKEPTNIKINAAHLNYKIPNQLLREDAVLQHPVFNQYHAEHEMLRYISKLERKDLSLNFSMIPLGSCTMKLNATTEMIPVTWPEFGRMHPLAPADQTKGYQELFTELQSMLCDITGFDSVSLQPNAGSQGEYAGLLSIRAYHRSRGDHHRNVCLIPKSAHGTNPASASMTGMKVVVVECDADGNIDVEDLKKRSLEHAKDLSCLMVTYPSTHGVFEAKIKEICEIIHNQGGQVYMDGANMNAQVGLCKPGEFGPDVCHLNLHKTFCIPHGGGGPGMGPIGVKKHLAPFLPEKSGAVSGAAFGSASILPISYTYIKMMGSDGLRKATEVAILNANYMAKRLSPHYPVLYRGESGLVAHECIIDLRPLKADSGIEVEDVAKRLMDYGFHAPTMSFPVAGTLMIEPTESESKAEMDRFIDAMIAIRHEIEDVKSKKIDSKNNPLKNAPHTAAVIASTEWNFPYSREQAAFPLPYVRDKKFWPAVSRIDNVYGDRNLVCSCAPIDQYT
jgi:glycine dehydrogenase